MPSKKELEQMRKDLREQLGYADDEPDDFGEHSSDEIEHIYEQIMSGQVDLNIPEDEPEPESESDTYDTRIDRSEEGSMGVDDAFTKYRQLLQQVHGMAFDWAERLGQDYAPFVESNGKRIVYGAAHRTDSGKTQFTEVAVPNSLDQELDLVEREEETGEVYKWALAAYEELLSDVKKARENSFANENRRHLLVESKRIAFYEGNALKYERRIPPKVRRVLGLEDDDD